MKKKRRMLSGFQVDSKIAEHQEKALALLCFLFFIELFGCWLSLMFVGSILDIAFCGLFGLQIVEANLDLIFELLLQLHSLSSFFISPLFFLSDIEVFEF